MVLLLSAAFRFLLAIRMPVGYDEIFDVSLGLLRAKGSAASILIEVPVERAAALAPLWWWVQWAPFAVLGDVSLLALRVSPIALGLLLLPLGYVCARRHFSVATAQVFVILIAASDILAFTASRGEFAESLLLVFLIPCMCMAGSPQRGLLRGALWTGLLLTHVGKGGLAVTLNIVAELVMIAGRRRWRELIPLAVSLVLPAIVFGVWYVVTAAHYANRPIVHAVGSFTSLGDLLWAITFEYPRYKAHVTGSPLDAMQVFLDARAWPLTAMSAPIMLAAIAARAVSLARQIQGGTRLSREQWRTLALLTWALLGFLAIVLRGTAGARFHLLYLPAAWLLTAEWFAAARPLPRRTLNTLAVLTAAWFVLAVSWQSWTERSLDWKQAIIVGLILVIVVITTSLIAHARRAPLARIMPWSCIIVAMIAAAFLGPMSWAQASINGHEPMHGSRALVLLDDSERPWRIQASEPTDNMYVYLANYFLAQHQLDDAQRYAVRASKYSPNDPLAWFYLGLVYDEQGRGIDERRAVWRRALDLNPDSQVIRQRWQRVQ